MWGATNGRGVFVFLNADGRIRRLPEEMGRIIFGGSDRRGKPYGRMHEFFAGGGFRNHQGGQNEPAEWVGWRVIFAAGENFYSVETKILVAKKGMAWGVLREGVSANSGRGKRTKGAVRLEGTLQGPGGTL